jgi:hypothetical protein
MPGHQLAVPCGHRVGLDVVGAEVDSERVLGTAADHDWPAPPAAVHRTVITGQLRSGMRSRQSQQRGAGTAGQR